MKCTQCELYNKGLFRCSIGKSNPQSLTKAKGIAELMGTSYICSKNEFKSQLACVAGII